MEGLSHVDVICQTLITMSKAIENIIFKDKKQFLKTNTLQN
jgi:hypothetical protein